VKKVHQPFSQLYHAPAAFPFSVLETPSAFVSLKGLGNAHRAALEIEV
jgi:hypothetical protein